MRCICAMRTDALGPDRNRDPYDGRDSDCKALQRNRGPRRGWYGRLFVPRAPPFLAELFAAVSTSVICRVALGSSDIRLRDAVVCNDAAFIFETSDLCRVSVAEFQAHAVA